MIAWFDYIAYRAAQFYVRHRSERVPWYSGVFVALVLAEITLLDCYLLLDVLLSGSLTHGRLSHYAPTVIGLLILGFGLHRYGRVVSMQKLNAIWGKEDNRERGRRKNWIAVFAVIVVILLPVATRALRMAFEVN